MYRFFCLRIDVRHPGGGLRRLRPSGDFRASLRRETANGTLLCGIWCTVRTLNLNQSIGLVCRCTLSPVGDFVGHIFEALFLWRLHQHSGLFGSCGARRREQTNERHCLYF